MKTYRAKLEMGGGFLSALQSDTFWGALCWAWRDLYGLPELDKVLAEARAGNPDWIVSDAFPRDYLPKPLLALAPLPSGERRERLAAAAQAKQAKDVRWLSSEEFEAWRQGRWQRPVRKENPVVTQPTLHNIIDRQTGGTLQENGLYSLTERYGDWFTLYVRVKPELEEKVQGALVHAGMLGIGGRRSLGKGSFQVAEWQEFSDWDGTDDDNGFISLSHFVPNSADPCRGHYKTTVKYPRVDREMAQSGQPFKRPMVMLQPGSVFWTGTRPQPFYGRAMEDVAAGLGDVVQGAFAFAVPCRLAEKWDGGEEG